jgi:hypothetical protein
MINTIFQGLIFLSYTSFLIYRFGVLPSISESHYRLDNTREGYLFTLFCWALSVLMIFQTNETSILFKWSGVHTGLIHYAGAVLGIGGALIGLCVEYNNIIPLCAFVSTALLLSVLEVRNVIWWVEIVAFLCIISGLLYRFV